MSWVDIVRLSKEIIPNTSQTHTSDLEIWRFYQRRICHRSPNVAVLETWIHFWLKQTSTPSSKCRSSKTRTVLLFSPMFTRLSSPSHGRWLLLTTTTSLLFKYAYTHIRYMQSFQRSGFSDNKKLNRVHESSRANSHSFDRFSSNLFNTVFY